MRFLVKRLVPELIGVCLRIAKSNTRRVEQGHVSTSAGEIGFCGHRTHAVCTALHAPAHQAMALTGHSPARDPGRVYGLQTIRT